jgi:hypothetical protein
MHQPMRLVTATAIVTSLTVLTMAPAANADLATTMQADLLNPASGVPGAQVSVAAPVGNQTLVGPGSAVNVTMTPPFGAALAGILVPPGAQPLYSTTSARLVAWDLAVVEAAKHALAAGNQFDSVSITRNYPGVAPLGYPDLITAPPVYLPLPQPSATMSLETVRAKVQEALPAWAQHGTITVSEDAASERVVTVKTTLPVDAFRTIAAGALVSTLLGRQVSLAPDGAKIGRVLAEIKDPVNGDPLYAGGADASVSYWSDWYSPLVSPLRLDVPISAMSVLKPPLDAASDAGAPPPPTGPLGTIP